jgi:Conserved TM helix
MQEVIMNDFFSQALLEPLQLLGRQMLTVLPNVLAMGIILLGGLFTAWASGSFVERLLRVIGFDHLCNRLGMNAALLRGGVKTDPSRLVGRGIYWTVIVLASIAALGALNLTPINQFAQSLLAYVPHLVTAAVILLAGYFLSNFVSQAVLIAAVNAGLPPARLIAACSRWGVQVLAAAMALEQLGIAQHIVVVGFGITWGGIVLAGAIALGLGAADLSKEFLERRLVARSKSNTVDDLHHW